MMPANCRTSGRSSPDAGRRLRWSRPASRSVTTQRLPGWCRTIRMSRMFQVCGVLLIVACSAGVTAGETGSMILVDPPRVVMRAGESHQILVTSDSLPETDRTSVAALSMADPTVAGARSGGLVRGCSPGVTSLTVQLDGHPPTTVEVVVGAIGPGDGPRFTSDVIPILTKLSCNSGGCHGKATGQNGFRLSLLGFEPEQDYESLVQESRGRRLFPAAPDQSLLLQKATARMPHGGGRRLDPAGDDYRILRDWIASGATPPRADEPQLIQIETTPRERTMQRHAVQQLRVTARFSDGTSRDVTRRAVYQSNEPEVANADADGLVRIEDNPGLATIMARFSDQVATFRISVPYTTDAEQQQSVQRQLDALEATLQPDAFVDRLLLQQWRRLAIAPSQLADDATFLRRASLDVCGTLPAPDEVRRFLGDPDPNKRSALIGQLLERPEYASYFALKWADILQNRGAGYSTSQQRPGTTLFASWIRDSLAANQPYDQFVTEILTASGSQNLNPPAVWYRTVRKSPEYVESVAQAFLGVRIQCAQCHHHPAERWSQTDYYGLAAVFARVGRKGGFADAEVPTNEMIFLKDSGEVLHPRTGQAVAPRALGGPPFELTKFTDPRRSLANWMTARDNPFFARTMVNRLWAHFLGRGIIHPIDDARSTNPPSNPELLAALAQDFADSGYDVRHLIRRICSSRAYQVESAPGEWNQSDTQTYARFYPRRLSAEVLLDAVSQALEVPTVFAGGPGEFPLGTRAIELPDENVPVHFLDVFGRPARMSACECERVDAPSLNQALELINSEEIHRKLTAENGFASRLAAGDRSHQEMATDVFLQVLGREPRPEERDAAAEFLSIEPDRREACRSLLWSLLATSEFLFNH